MANVDVIQVSTLRVTHKMNCLVSVVGERTNIGQTVVNTYRYRIIRYLVQKYSINV